MSTPVPPPPPGYTPVPPPAAAPPPPPAAGPPPQPQPSGGRIPPWAVVVGVVVILVVIGGIGLLVARAAGPVQATAVRADPQPTQSVVPLPDQPTPTTEPFTPSPQPTATDQPTDQPTELPTETATPEPTDSPLPDPTDQPSGDALDIGLGLSVVVPDGWQVPQPPPGDGSVLLATAGAIVGVNAIPGFQTATAAEVATSYAQQVLARDIDRLKLGKAQPVSLDSPTVTSAAILPYKGVLVSQQGTQQVTGTVFVFLRQDGTALIVDETQRPDVDVSADLGIILGSLLSTF